MSFVRRRPEINLALALPETMVLVEPLAGGWCVSSAYDETLMFLSGGQAESQARKLARCFAGIGQDTVVEIHDRNDVVVGAVLYPSGRPGMTVSLLQRHITASSLIGRPQPARKSPQLPRPSHSDPDPAGRRTALCGTALRSRMGEKAA